MVALSVGRAFTGSMTLLNGVMLVTRPSGSLGLTDDDVEVVMVEQDAALIFSTSLTAKVLAGVDGTRNGPSRVGGDP